MRFTITESLTCASYKTVVSKCKGKSFKKVSPSDSHLFNKDSVWIWILNINILRSIVIHRSREYASSSIGVYLKRSSKVVRFWCFCRNHIGCSICFCTLRTLTLVLIQHLSRNHPNKNSYDQKRKYGFFIHRFSVSKIES